MFKPPQVPVLPGSSLIEDAGEAVKVAEEIGFPVLLKATGGGGGRGIFICKCAPLRVEEGGGGRSGWVFGVVMAAWLSRVACCK